MNPKYNDFKTHTARRNDTANSICFEYGISEKDLVQANPNIPLASYGGFFGSPTYKLDIKQGDLVKIPFFNHDKAKKGVKTIKGKSTVKVGIEETYEVSEWYAGTPENERNEANVKWALYHLPKGENPKWLFEKEKGKIRFLEKAAGNKYKVVGYIHQPELNNASGIVVNVEPTEKREIISVKLSDINDKHISSAIAYGQTINVHVETTGMKGEYIHISLWEDDINGSDNSEQKKHNLVAEGKAIVGNKGVAFKQFVLKPDFSKIANAYMAKGNSNEGSTHEYYVTAFASGESKSSINIDVRNPDYNNDRKKETQEHLSGSKTAPKTGNNGFNEDIKPATNPTSKTTDVPTLIASTGLKVDVSTVKIDVAESTSVVKVGDSKPTINGIEAILDAYFAKEEFKKETSEAAGQHKYTFQKDNKEIDKQKDKIAGIIKKRVDAQVKPDKKYAKLDDIKNALIKASYKKGEGISINLHKLGPEYVRINNAPLEEEVYVVAKTAALDGKEVTIKIKEKETVLIAKEADLTVLEAKENGNEITSLKATAENGIAKIKVKLRPKSGEDLKTWKDKLKGVKDGSHTYTFGSEGNNTKTDEQKKKIAGIIANKVNKSLSEQKKFVKTEDVVRALTNDIYNKGQQITFDLYKEVTEYLWLKAECQGDTKKHEGEFLKKDGAYFMIGKKCECEERIRAFMRMLRVKEGTENEKGYTTLYSGEQFTDMSKHPEKVITSGAYSSSAAGAYQIMQDTYKGFQGYYKDEQKKWQYSEKLNYIKKYNINSFDQESQDKLCLVIFKHNYVQKRPNGFFYKQDGTPRTGRSKFNNAFGDIIQMIINDNFDKAILTSSLCWASLPDSPYGQPTGTKEECKANYEKFLKEELVGKSDLYLKKGFLKEFGYNCCDNTGSTKWQNPLKNNQITIHTFGGGKKPWRSAFGRVRTDMTGSDNGARPHHGLDLFAEIGTEVFACLPGEVVSLTPGTGYGNGFVFKIDDNYLNEFKNQRRNYSPYYVKAKRTYDSKKYDIEGYGDFEEYEGISESESVYLMYAHLSEVLVKLNEKITEFDMTKVLGKTGTSGATNTKGPHLHFEIRSKQNPSGYTDRYNPAYYIDYKNEEQITNSERKTQDTAAGK